MTFGQLKGKITATTGTPADYQKLFLMQDGKRQGQLLGDDMMLLHQFNFGNFVHIHVVDTNPTSKLKELSDANLARVTKYEMDDEDYGQRKNSVRTWKTGILAQRKIENKDATEAAAAERAAKEAKYAELASAIEVGSRCQCTEERRGEVKFVGFIPQLQGTWVGVELDEPFGKNDGSVKKKRYFTCLKNYGVFVRPDQLEIGDFPEEDIFDEL
jgi:tubulin-folding cofactor B